MTAREEPPIIVRRAADDDRAAALELISPATGRGRASQTLLRAHQGILWVAVAREERAEMLVGLLLATAQVDAEAEEVAGYIHELLVHPAFRRRGVAMELLDAAERYFLDESDFSTVLVTTSFDNDAAIRLYRSRGYTLSQARLAKRRGSTQDVNGANGRSDDA
ncbi:MAG TPA: N-acetyltransferase [Ktedonobacterales bacterium]|nr:N-acetyltransferase [Ktedonobacterales bacterium]